jgi:argininosuccinate lyase
MTREQLAFETVHEPVTAVQLSRGKAEAHLAFEIVILLQDLGRLAADVILFNTSEFGFVALTGSVTTGSSIMPQKRNPDVFELVRGRSATAVACLHEVLGVTAKLTSGYHRDLQLIKAPLFRAIDLAHDMLQITAHALAAVHFRPDRIRLGEELFATEEAYRLVQEEGLTFREAYRKVARRFADPD